MFAMYKIVFIIIKNYEIVRKILLLICLSIEIDKQSFKSNRSTSIILSLQKVFIGIVQNFTHLFI